VIVVYNMGAELPKSLLAIGNAVLIFIFEDESVLAELANDVVVLAIGFVKKTRIQLFSGILAQRLL